MLPAGATSKVFAGYKKIPLRYFLRKAWVNSLHCMFCKFFVIVYLQIRARNNHICINVVVVVFVNPASYAPVVAPIAQFLISLGSVILPVTAEAATTIGDARYVFDSTWPILPGKFRLVVLMHTSSLPSTPIWAPQQAPHVGGPTTAPACIKMLISPSFNAFMYIDCAAGSTSVLILTFLSFRILAAARRSSSLAPVHEPMYALSISVPCSSLAAEIFSGENGLATVGSSFSISYVKTSK